MLKIEQTDKAKEKKEQEEKNKIIDTLKKFYFSVATLKDINEYIQLSRIDEEQQKHRGEQVQELARHNLPPPPNAIRIPQGTEGEVFYFVESQKNENLQNEIIKKQAFSKIPKITKLKNQKSHHFQKNEITKNFLILEQEKSKRKNHNKKRNKKNIEK